MDALMGFIWLLVAVGAVIVFASLIGLVALALFWAGYHRVHDHWTWTRLRQEAQTRLFGAH